MRRAVPRYKGERPPMVTVHLPMRKDVREKVSRKAFELGFDSLQSYIRFWAVAEAEGRHIDYGDGSIPVQIKRYQQTGKYMPTYTDAEFLAELGGPDFTKEPPEKSEGLW